MLTGWLFSFLFALPSSQGHRSQQWPQVRPVTARFTVDLRAEKARIDLPIKDQAGRTLYYFACRGVSETYLDSLPGNWVGPLMCTLAEGGQAKEESLLSEDGSAAWHSRGQFRGEDLVGACAGYPEFGVHRSFRLRGFRLNLAVQDIETDDEGKAQSFILAVSVVNDAAATTSEAARPGFLNPHRSGASCNSVVRGQEPLMCRDDQGSWQACKY
jgi:hypothetical protein